MEIQERIFEFAIRIVKLCQYLDEKPGVERTLSRSGFKTLPQNQFLRWNKIFNPRNIMYIPAVENFIPS